MYFRSLLHQIVLWIFVPVACVIGFVWFQLDALHFRFIDYLERDVASECERIERELGIVLTTTEQIAAMTARDSKILQGCKNRETDSLYRIGSNLIASTLIDQMIIADQQGIVLARGHDEFGFNDRISENPLFAIAASGKTFSGLARVDDAITFVVAQPIWEFGAVFRGVLIVSRAIAPQYLARIGQELGLTITINRGGPPNPVPLRENEGLAQFIKELPFASLDNIPMMVKISKSYRAEVATLEDIGLQILLFSLMATTAAMVFVYVSVSFLLRPMRQLRTWLQQHKEGLIDADDLHKNIISQNTTKNELGFIAHAALSTIQDLEVTRKELQRMHRDLELLVEERTRQLWQKTSQLQEEVRERQHAETRVLGLKNHLQNIFDSMRCTLIGVDSTSMVTFINAHAEKFSGLSYEQLCGEPVERVLRHCGIPQEDITGVLKHSGNQWQLHRSIVRHRGRQLYFDITTYPFSYGAEKGMVIRIDDVSQQVLLEQELFKLEKIKSIGLLAGGIAHDFNNFLTAILGNINVVLTEQNLSDPVRKMLDGAEQACLAAKELTAQLLTFAKGGEPRIKVCALGEIVREAAQCGVLGGRFSYSLSSPDDLWPVAIDRVQIQQVIRNIVVNATQVIPAGESIAITCTNIDSSDVDHLQQINPGPYVCITIADRGPGMPPEILSQIFDPYFTTKSEGNGLGLAICHSIVRKHNGTIAVESSLENGTTFSIYLPARPGATVTLSSEEPRHEGEQRQLRILVMDDDPMICEVLGAMLDLLGHQVLFAHEGEEAINTFRKALEAGVPIDLIIMDLVIPGGMGGKMAIREILRIQPDAKVIVSSGYSNDPVLANYPDYGFSAAMAKPYQLKELARVINELTCAQLDTDLADETG